MTGAHDHHDHHHHESGHGHHLDQGWRGLLRYLRHGRRMWDSDVNRAAVDVIDPRRGETIVDIGAGFGPAVTQIVKRGARAVAVDPTPNMRKVLGVRRLLGRSTADIEVVDGAAEDLPLVDASADAVMTVNTMHHWADPGAAITEIARVLKPGGRVVLVDEVFDDPTHPRFDPESDHQHHHHHEFLDIEPSDLAQKLASAGFIDTVGDRRRLGGAPVKYVAGRRSPVS